MPTHSNTNVLSRAEKLQLSEAVSQPICSTTECTQSAFKLLNALCNGSSENISTLHNLLTSYFYSGEWGQCVCVHVGEMKKEGRKKEGSKVK